MKAGSPGQWQMWGGCTPTFTGREAASLPLRSFRMSSAAASNPSSGRALGRLGILGCGRFRCELQTRLQPSRPPSQGLSEQTLNPASKRSASAAQIRSSAARARAGVAHLQSVTQGHWVRRWVEVGGTDRGRAGAAAGRSVTERWEPIRALARRHSAAGVRFSRPCSGSAAHPSRSFAGAHGLGRPLGAGEPGGLRARMNGRPGDARARGAEGH